MILRYLSPLAAAILALALCTPSAAVAEVPPDQAIIRPQDPPDIQSILNPAANTPPNAGAQLRNSQGRREIRVGLYENKPKIFTGENGRAAGIFAAVLEEIARREQWDVTYVPCNWHECLAALDEGRIDLMPDVALSSERDGTFDFHREAVIESWSQVYVNRRKPAATWSDLNGRRVALLKGSVQQTTLERMINGLGYSISIVEANSYEEAFALAAKGSVDAVVTNHFFGSSSYREYGLQSTALVFNPVSLYFATDRGARPDLLEAIDRNLRAMKSEAGSAYYRELARWLERPPRVAVPRYLVWVLGAISGLLALAFLMILVLRRQVRSRTEHLVQANETLRESEEKFRSLFQNHAAVKLITDPDSGTIIDANEAAVAFYGWPGEQLRRMRIQDINILSPEQVEAETEQVKARPGVHFELRHRLADGSIRDVEVLSSTIAIRGKRLLHSIIHDITEHRKLEEQYRQAQKMEAVGRLAGGVAHDFNNILGVIIGYAELALERVGQGDPLRDDLQEIHTAAERSRNIVQQLLAFARKETIAPEVLDLNVTVESLLKILRRLIGEDIDLTWRPGNGLEPVFIDPSQLDQILANLCVNARDAIADVGRITIETTMVTFDDAYCSEHLGFVPGRFTLLSVSDDGCGMDCETLDKIFEPFFTTKGEGEGTGLGLATVYGIVKQNNGFINVYSEPGEGTTFRVYLPIQAGGVPEEHRQTLETTRQGSGETLLVVEDETSILKLIEQVLTNNNYRVLTAQTPSEALRKAAAHKGVISLLLTDVVLPEMNGRELSEKLTTLYPGLKCLYMSGYTANIIAHRGVLDKGFHFIPKPFSTRVLADKIRKVLDE
ncbi:MAG: ATP-binding protein [Desulfobulbaceae bacterium]